MSRVLSVLASAALVLACDDPRAAVAAADPAPAVEAPAAAASDGPLDCAALAGEVAAERFGGQLEPVLEHTVPFRTAAVGGDGCFLTFYHDVKAPQLELGADFPYPYAFVVADGDGFLKEISLAAEDLPALTLSGVAFEDVDGNGEDDVFLVHEEGRGFALLSEGEAGLQDWAFSELGGALYETVAEVRDHYRAAYDPAARAAAVGLATVTVTNATGMTLVFLYAAGCTESEGEDWDAMSDWATDYLGDEVLEADGAVALDLAPGCYVLNPVWEDDTSLMERVEVDGDTTVDLTLG